MDSSINDLPPSSLPPVIPTSLGVNPSLTISALALRIADKIIQELPRAGS